MHQSVFRHQHVETCNSIHQHLETVIPISMGRTLTLWPHGGRPVSLAESLLQLLSLGHSFPPIVFSLLHVAWEILVGCRGTPDFEENHEKKKHNKPIPNNKQILTIPALLALSVYHLQIQHDPTSAILCRHHPHPILSTGKMAQPLANGGFSSFSSKFFKLTRQRDASGM